MEFLTNFTVWCLAVFGCSNAMVVSALMKPFRDWVAFTGIELNEKGELIQATPRKWKLPSKLVNCPMCLGFWFGILWSVCVWSPSYNQAWHSGNYCQYMGYLYDGFVGSITSWILYLWISPKQFGK